MHAVPVKNLAALEQELVGEVVRIEQLKLQALDYDATNFHTHIACCAALMAARWR